MAVVEHDILRTIHRMHRQIADLRSRIEKGPRQLKSSTLKVEAAKQNLDERKAALKKTQVLANEKQLLLKQREDKIKEYQGKLNAANSNDEFQALKNQIAADEQANEVLSDEIFEQLEKIDVVNQQIVDAGSELDDANAARDKVKTRIENETEGLETDLSRVLGELAEMEEKMPIDIKAEYTRVAGSKGEEALAAVEDNVCGGCYCKITMMQHSDLAANKPVFCKSCGAILYLPENTRV